MKLLICAGGTGGGIYPALAAVTALRAKGITDDQMLWIGTKGEMEEQLVPRAGLRLETIAGGAVVGVAPHIMLRNLFRLGMSIPKAMGIIRRFRPDVMFMTGGYMAAPVTLACRLLGVPICIYLPDLEPGKSIRFSVPFAKTIGATTEGSKQFVPEEKMTVTGYPVRPLLRQALEESKADALAHFTLTTKRPTLFVFGGSRGAWAINEALMGILPELLKTIQVIHISGTLTWPQVEANANKLTQEQQRHYRPFPFLHEDMGIAFRAADLVLARAGASMLGESPAFGLPSILVPLTFAWRYQKVNADFLTERGAAIQLTDEQLPEQMLPTVLDLLNDSAKLTQMQQAAEALDVANAAEQLAELVIKTAAVKNLDTDRVDHG